MRSAGISAAALAFVLAATPSLAFSPASPQPTLRVAPTVSSFASTESAPLTRRHVAKSSSITKLRMADAAAAEEPEESVGGGTATISQEIFNLIKASEFACGRLWSTCGM